MTPRIGMDKQIIVAAAVEIADAEGLESVTLARVAEKLGVRSPSLYNHINGLQELRMQLTLLALNRLQAAMADAAQGHAGEEGLRRVSRAYVSFARMQPGLYEAVLRSPDPAEQQVGEAASAIVKLVQEQMSCFGLEGDASLHAVRGFRSMLHGFAELERAGGFGLPLDLNKTLELMIEAFGRGLPVYKEALNG
ncbi:TetR family transcriptional regulator [Paenibacillus sambharensis]|uniref:TetR family transcriptional regulator n=1 Tax=Paenibacillus sambharensis TaxID=1803190 RepID=A0A2W1LP30_9BACL|nr:TetR/AcrR family transcriptional regulator [Paenibacillus sambharensis]PZD93167.1 TetR family transcriptional regulator [Paenibacillus sambharensis]